MQTLDGITALRCMFVGLSDDERRRCAAALVPIQTVNVDGVKEACARMSSVLPLVVVVGHRFDDALLAELRDVADTCAAEVMIVDDPMPTDLEHRLHDALRRADRRRTGKGRRDV